MFSMIGSLEGIIKWKDERMLILDVGGVGYAVFATPALQSALAIGDRAFLFTHLAVREDALDLYGFLEHDELTLFRLLIGISGIGPKSALNVLALADRSTLIHAIQKGEAAYLTKVSGIGKKLAEKIILELRDKVAGWDTPHTSSSAESDALDALEALGYLPKDTRDIVRALASDLHTSEDIIRRALQVLGGHTK
jgi:Holliday junction DNA helicase RuvA